MFFGKSTTATTKAEVDAALRTADRIVVKGNDDLLSYAATRAANYNAPGVSIESIEVTGPGFTIEDMAPEPGPSSLPAAPPPLVAASIPPPPPSLAATSISPTPARSAPNRRWLPLALSAGAAVVLLVGIPTIYLSQKLAPASSEVAEQGSAVSPAPTSSPSPPQSAPQPQAQSPERGHPEASPPSKAHARERPLPDLAGPKNAAARPEAGPPPTLIQLAWPIVALTAVIGMFLLANKAIGQGSDVRIQWKVTEKASGSLIITKHRGRTPRAAAARAA